ncbi:hypothetical protein Pla52o_19770 [Novipirellula galeiformis]|uniref:PAS domain-containing protein n=1 Tax=Novipirellula galeiformis TaxID=2528004 RepID=A0A5C6CKQ8_9BACT|nr:PAS domain-containing protein [Novipirellula galeiformis]TWU24054.1 hypothetical protein Pla52o_19770 [Novipirellula galeiformis]
MSERETEASDILLRFFYEREFEHANDAVVVLQISSPLNVVAANRSACELLEWPSHYRTSAFAEEILAITGLDSDVNHWTRSAQDELSPVPSAPKQIELGSVQWTPFQNGRDLFAMIVIKPNLIAVATEGASRLASDASLAQATNSMAVAHWIKTFIHEICQPLHVNQSMADIIELEAEKNLLDATSLQPRLERMQSAGKQLRECLSNFRKQIHLIEPEFTGLNIHKLLHRTAASFPHSSQSQLRLAIDLAEPFGEIHGNEALLENAILTSLELLRAATVRDPSPQPSPATMNVTVHDEQIQIELMTEATTTLAFIEEPLLEQPHPRLLPAAKWSVCDSIVQLHHGELRRVTVNQSDRIQIQLPVATTKTLTPNSRVSLHRAW